MGFTPTAFINHHHGANFNLFSPKQKLIPTLWDASTEKISLVTHLRMGTASNVVLRDFAGIATSYFYNTRTPASLLAGSSLGAIFAVAYKRKGSGKESKIERLLTTTYHIIMGLTWVSSMNAVVFATTASLRAMNGQFNPMAATPYLLIRREFYFEYITTRFSYLSSLILFFAGIANRAILEFELYDKKNKNTGLAIVFLTIAFVTNIISYINGTLFAHGHFLEMGFTLMKVNMFVNYFNDCIQMRTSPQLKINFPLKCFLFYRCFLRRQKVEIM